MRASARALAATCAIALSACGGATVGPANPGHRDGNGAVASTPELEVRSLGKRPPLLLLTREGDASAALAIAVAVDGGAIEAAGLSALLEARLRRAGITDVDATWDRAGYRVRVLVADADAAKRAVTAAMGALTGALGEEADVKKLAKARIAALKARSLEDSALAPIAECSGRLSIAGTDTLPDPTTPSGAAALEAWRASAHGTGAVAMALVGTDAIAAAAEKALSDAPEMNAATLTQESWPAPSEPAVYVEGSRPRGTARLSVAWRVADRSAALAFAERASGAKSPLVTRLLALPLPFRARSVTATLRRSGACISVEAESDVDDAAGSHLASSAALAKLVIERDLSSELSIHANDPSVAARQIRSLADPREAASAAAWWALSQPGPERPPLSVSALGVAPQALSARVSSSDASSPPPGLAKRFADAVHESEAPREHPSVEPRSIVERGQGEVWMLLASTCAVHESQEDDGLAAMGATAAARAAGDEGVDVEPWVAPDGAGLMLHLRAMQGETPDELSIRAANALGRAFVNPLTVASVDAARGSLLARLEREGERHRSPIADTLGPGDPSAFLPWGDFESVARASAESVRLRWATLANGPLRLSMLANESSSQAAAAARAIEQWTLPANTERRCPSFPAITPSLQGSRSVVLPPRRPSRAFVGVPVDASAAGAANAGLTVLALQDDDGLLARALADTGVKGTAYLLGHGARTALVVELRGPDPSLEAAAAQTRELLGRLGKGAVSDADLARASARLRSQDLEQHLSPRTRLLDLWRGDSRIATPTISTWRAWLASELRDERFAVVLARMPEAVPPQNPPAK